MSDERELGLLEILSGDNVVQVPEQRDDKGYDISIMLTAFAYMGDHSETVHEAYEYVPGETIEELVERVMPYLVKKARGELPKNYHCSYSDCIEIRVAVPKEEGKR